RPGTPTVNGLSAALLHSNPNANAAGNATGATNPFRLDRTQAVTADQGHNYGPEQAATHMGLMDLFPLKVGTAGAPPNAPPQIVTTKGLTMGYFDGNTVTAFWNYAQNFAMSDNSYDTVFGPSTPGMLNLVDGQTNGLSQVTNGTGSETDGGSGSLTVIGDPDPIGDVCSAPTRNQVQLAGKNIGDLLNDAGVSWGSFMGGFALNVKNSNGTTGCTRSSAGLAGTPNDYIPPPPPPCLLPVPPLDRHSEAHAAELACGNRARWAGKPQLRHHRFLQRAEERHPAGGQLREGAGVPGWPRRILRPARRADLRGQG